VDETVINYRRSARASADNMQDQRALAFDWAARNGLVIGEEVEEIGSGLLLHPRLESLIRRAERGERMVLIVSGIDRISRSREILDYVFGRLAAAGVRVQIAREDWQLRPQNLVFAATCMRFTADIERQIERGRIEDLRAARRQGGRRRNGS
jgi:DNA invertase Pin-like site-specific DNA recombinase